MSTCSFDVLIVGGGMVGASLAAALARDEHSPSVAVVEKHPLLGCEAAFQPSFDARSTALSLSSVEFFDGLGLWSPIRERAEAITRIHVSDRGRFGSTRLQADEEGLEALGYVVENRWMGRVLQRHMQDNPRISVFAPAELEQIELQGEGVRACLHSGSESFASEAGILVLADGARSTLAATLGIATQSRSYGQVALIANVSHDKAHRGCAFERFTDQGPLAMLPLLPAASGEPRSALVWVMPPERAGQMQAVAEQEFLGLLQQQFGYRLGRLRRVGERHAYPLVLHRASEQVRSAVVVVGNAAHALHPVAGQGFNLSVRDIARLAQVLREEHRFGRALGKLPILQRYSEAQGADQLRTIGFSDVLPRLFGAGLLPLVFARDLGLIALNLLPAARHLFVRQATGLPGP